VLSGKELMKLNDCLKQIGGEMSWLGKRRFRRAVKRLESIGGTQSAEMLSGALTAADEPALSTLHEALVSVCKSGSGEPVFAQWQASRDARLRSVLSAADYKPSDSVCAAQWAVATEDFGGALEPVLRHSRAEQFEVGSKLFRKLPSPERFGLLVQLLNRESGGESSEDWTELAAGLSADEWSELGLSSGCWGTVSAGLKWQLLVRAGGIGLMLGLPVLKSSGFRPKDSAEAVLFDRLSETALNLLVNPLKAGLTLDDKERETFTSTYAHLGQFGPACADIAGQLALDRDPRVKWNIMSVLLMLGQELPPLSSEDAKLEQITREVHLAQKQFQDSVVKFVCYGLSGPPEWAPWWQCAFGDYWLWTAWSRFKEVEEEEGREDEEEISLPAERAGSKNVGYLFKTSEDLRLRGNVSHLDSLSIVLKNEDCAVAVSGLNAMAWIARRAIIEHSSQVWLDDAIKRLDATAGTDCFARSMGKCILMNLRDTAQAGMFSKPLKV